MQRTGEERLEREAPESDTPKIYSSAIALHIVNSGLLRPTDVERGAAEPDDRRNCLAADHCLRALVRLSLMAVADHVAMNSTGLFRLLGDGELVTFRDVGDYIAKLPGRK